jgi:hypothetical protein
VKFLTKRLSRSPRRESSVRVQRASSNWGMAISSRYTVVLSKPNSPTRRVTAISGKFPVQENADGRRKHSLEPACSTLRLRDFVVRMETAGKSRFPFSSELGHFSLDATVIVDRIAAKST